MIPENMRAVAILVSEIVGVANYVEVGDKVDILATHEFEVDVPGEEEPETVQMTYTQLQNIGGRCCGRKEGSAEEETIQQPASLHYSCQSGAGRGHCLGNP